MKPRVQVTKVPANLYEVKIRDISGLTEEDWRELPLLGLSNVGTLSDAVFAQNGDLRGLSIPGVTVDKKQSIRVTDALGAHLRRNYPGHPTTEKYADWSFESEVVPPAKVNTVVNQPVNANTPAKVNTVVNQPVNAGLGTRIKDYIDNLLDAPAGTLPK